MLNGWVETIIRPNSPLIVRQPTDPYSEYSEAIEAVLAHLRRRHRLTPDLGDEFSSWAMLRLIDNDCAVLRKFRGQSQMRTYLTSVLVHLFQDWRNMQWGRWRPTAAARRLGAVAIELERLVLRDNRPYDESVETLISAGVVPSRPECDETWAKLRRLPARKVTSTDDLNDVPAPRRDHDTIDFKPARELAARTAVELGKALRSLSHQEQIILRLSFLAGFTAKQIGAVMELEAKPLYRRIERIQEKLGEILAAAGLPKDEILALFGNPEVDLEGIMDRELRKLEDGPSTSENAGGKDDE